MVVSCVRIPTSTTHRSGIADVLSMKNGSAPCNPSPCRGSSLRRLYVTPEASPKPVQRGAQQTSQYTQSRHRLEAVHTDPTVSRGTRPRIPKRELPTVSGGKQQTSNKPAHRTRTATPSMSRMREPPTSTSEGDSNKRTDNAIGEDNMYSVAVPACVEEWCSATRPW